MRPLAPLRSIYLCLFGTLPKSSRREYPILFALEQTYRFRLHSISGHLSSALRVTTMPRLSRHFRSSGPRKVRMALHLPRLSARCTVHRWLDAAPPPRRGVLWKLRRDLALPPSCSTPTRAEHRGHERVDVRRSGVVV